jgi:hypothetical protein
MMFITPVNVTPSATGAYEDVDVSAHIPSGATGVILHLVNTHASNSSTCRIRKNGSTDDFNDDMHSVSHTWLCIGVDGSRIFEARVGATTTIYLVGYFESEAVFFTNAVIKNVSTSDVWEDMSIASDTGSDTAIGAIFTMRDFSIDDWGLRKNGSTDNRFVNSNAVTGAIVGVDGSEILEAYSNFSSLDFRLVGYIKSGAVFNTNAADLSLGSTGSYQDLSALPSGASGAIIEVISSSGNTDLYALREDGSSEDIYQGTGDEHCFAFVEASSLIIEGKISSTNVDFYLVGYFLSPGSPSSSQSPSLSPSASASPSSSVSPSSTPSPSVSPSSSLSPSASVSPSSSVSPSVSPSSSASSSLSASPSPADYGIKVKKPSVNKDVEDITDPKELVFTSARGVLGLHTLKTVNGTTDSNGNINTTSDHGIGYPPVTIVTVTTYDGFRVLAPCEWHAFYQNGLGETVEVIERFNFKLDGTKIRIIAHAESYNHDTFTTTNLASRAYAFKVYHYFNEIIETY